MRAESYTDSGELNPVIFKSIHGQIQRIKISTSSMLALTFLRDLLMPMAKQNIKLCQKVTYYNAAFLMPKICNASIIDYFFSLKIIFNICYLF